MTWNLSASPLSFADRLRARREEREFAALIDRTFRPDPESIARVRSRLFLATAMPAPRQSIWRREALTRAWQALSGGSIRIPRAVPVAMGVIILVGAALAVNAPRAGDRVGATQAGVARIGQAATDIDLAAARLDQAMPTIRQGDEAAIATVLTAYRADLLRLDLDLQRPGVDLVTAATRLRTQSAVLATMAGSIPAADASLYGDVTGELDRIIASLPGGSPTGPGTDHPTPTDHPGNTDHPTPKDHPGNTDHPTPTDHPGNTSHPTKTDHPTATSHPTPHPKGGGNSTAGGNGNGHANGQTKDR